MDVLFFIIALHRTFSDSVWPGGGALQAPPRPAVTRHENIQDEIKDFHTIRVVPGAGVRWFLLEEEEEEEEGKREQTSWNPRRERKD